MDSQRLVVWDFIEARMIGGADQFEQATGGSRDQPGRSPFGQLDLMGVQTARRKSWPQSAGGALANTLWPHGVDGADSRKSAGPSRVSEGPDYL